MFTDAAAATEALTREIGRGAHSPAELRRMGCTPGELRSRLAAGRWTRHGLAVVTHNGPLTRDEQCRVAVLNCGPRAVLASFSAAEELGLTGWERAEVHVLTPGGVRRPELPGIPLVLHRARVIDADAVLIARRCQRIAPALVLAASSFRAPRLGCGILAAGVQQRLTTARDLRRALLAAPRLRHLAALRSAVDDIAMGAAALSEIDFVRLCRRHRLPPPTQQAVRVETGGRRRYLDAEWTLPGGRRLVVEVDGAVHLAPRRWFDDQLRQNEIALGGALVLRYPSVVVRTEEPLVVAQLRRALAPQPWP